MIFKIRNQSALNKNEALYSENFLKDKYTAFKKTINNENHGFFKTIERTNLLDQSQEVYKKFLSKKHFVQVGVGGSSLGPEMLVSALKKENSVKFTFVNNIDPDALKEQLDTINIEKALFYVVSKSGGTAETMAAFSIITNLLLDKGVSKDDLCQYFVFATDPKKSQLLEIGKEFNIALLEVPSDVGGRFSVLTPVGFLPALFAGINVSALLEGSKEMATEMLSSDHINNPLLSTASFLFDHYENGYDQTVFMPYSSKLRKLADWFIQLWAESLGKAQDINGKTVNKGLTPIASYGATDQHSQMQLFMEGPFNKCLFLIEVESFDSDFTLSNNFSHPSLKKIAPFSLAQLFKAELQGTIKALEENKRPFIHLVLSRNDERNLGALILFLESLTALMGHYLEVNPFDQPGVELGKKYAFEWLNKLES